MKLILCAVKYKKKYGDKWEDGIRISGREDLDSNGEIIVDKYFAIKTTCFGQREFIPFKFHDMFDIGYYNMEEFSIGTD